MDVFGMSQHELEMVARNHNNPNFQDETLHVSFSRNAVPDQEASEREGRPIYKEVDWIVIRVPGSRDTVERKVRESDKMRFPKQWAAFQAGKSQEAVVGTPLSAWPGVTRAQVEEFAFFGVKTVEQLAEMPDQHLQKFMGGQALRQRAKDFIAAAKDAAPLAQLRSEVEKRDADIEALKAQVASLLAANKEAARDEKAKK